MTAQVFHSLGFYWARETGMYEIEIDDEVPPVDTIANADAVEERWRAWAAKETQLRALLGETPFPEYCIAIQVIFWSRAISLG